MQLGQNQMRRLCGGKKLKIQKGRQGVSAYSVSIYDMVCMLGTCENGLSLFYCLNFRSVFVVGTVVIPLAATHRNIYEPVRTKVKERFDILKGLVDI
jgi:predicted nucleic acid-binding protein